MPSGNAKAIGSVAGTRQQMPGDIFCPCGNAAHPRIRAAAVPLFIQSSLPEPEFPWHVGC